MPLAVGAALLAYWAAASVASNRYGIADNGDYTRSMTWFVHAPVGMVNWPDVGDAQLLRRRFHDHWLIDWQLGSDGHPEPLWTSTALLWLPGVALNRLMYSSAVLDIRFLSVAPRLAVLAFLALTARWFLRAGAGGAALLFTVPALLMLTDTNYTSYFNTFYQETGLLVFLLALLLVLHHRGPTANARWLAALALCTALLTWSKSSAVHVPFGVLAVVALGGRWRSRQARSWLPIAAAVAIVIAAAGYRMTRWDSRCYEFHSLYFGALTFSDEPSAHLVALGLDPATESLVGKPAFVPETEAFIASHGDGLSYRHTVAVIRREPAVLWRMLVYAAGHLDVHDLRLGRMSAELPAAATMPFTSWTTGAVRLLPRGAWLYPILAVMALAGIGLMRGAPGALRSLGSCLAFCAIACALDTAMAILGDGRQEIAKHLFFATVLYGFAWIYALAAAAMLVRAGATTRTEDDAAQFTLRSPCQ